MIRRIASFVVCVVLLAFQPASLHAAQKAAKVKNLKLGTVAPKDSSFHKILQLMGEKWKSAPEGGVKLTIYPGGGRGGEAKMVKEMRQGFLDAALLTVAGLSEIDESVEALQSMPMMFHTLEEVDYVGEKLRPRLEKKLREKGFVVLFWADAGWVRFFSRQPVVRPADLKRLKLFTWAGDVQAEGIYKAAGYQPVPLETGDILPSLQTKMIDAVPLPPYAALTMQVFDQAPHMLDVNWAPLVGALVVSEKSWNGLSPATRTALYRAAIEAGGQMKIQNRRESDVAVQEMVKRKLKVQKVTPEIEAEWRKAAEAAYPQIRGKIVPAELFDEVKALLAEYRANAAAKKTATK